MSSHRCVSSVLCVRAPTMHCSHPGVRPSLKQTDGEGDLERRILNLQLQGAQVCKVAMKT